MAPGIRKKSDRWPEVKQAAKRASSAYAAVGYPGETTGARIHTDAQFNLASLAATHELGSPARNIPARPFMRKTAQRVSPRLALLVRVLWKKVQEGKMPMDLALRQIGVYFESEMKKSFTVEVFEPLKQDTIDAKGSSRPLIDTSQLRNGITSTVRFDNVPVFGGAR